MVISQRPSGPWFSETILNVFINPWALEYILSLKDVAVTTVSEEINAPNPTSTASRFACSIAASFVCPYPTP